MNQAIEGNIIYWHRRYYGSTTIAPLVGQSIEEVQKVIWAYEIRMGKAAR